MRFLSLRRLKDFRNTTTLLCIPYKRRISDIRLIHQITTRSHHSTLVVLFFPIRRRRRENAGSSAHWPRESATRREARHLRSTSYGVQAAKVLPAERCWRNLVLCSVDAVHRLNGRDNVVLDECKRCSSCYVGYEPGI